MWTGKKPNGLWEIDQLFPHLQNIISKHRQNFDCQDTDEKLNMLSRTTRLAPLAAFPVLAFSCFIRNEWRLNLNSHQEATTMKGIPHCQGAEDIPAEWNRCESSKKIQTPNVTPCSNLTPFPDFSSHSLWQTRDSNPVPHSVTRSNGAYKPLS